MDRRWLILFIISAALLLILLFRTKPNIRWFGYALLHVIVASIVLFLFNGSGLFGDFYIPINPVTVLTVAILGLPGLALIAAVKLTVLPA